MRNFNFFKDFNYINTLVFNNLYKIPNDIDLIIGIPRSGLLVGGLVAEYINKPIMDLYSVNEHYKNLNLNPMASKTPLVDLSKVKKVLLVDDTVYAGTTMKNAIAFIKENFNFEIVTYCIFVKPGMGKNCDIFCQETEHFIPWNILKVSAGEACFDMDGVLCEEVPAKFDTDDSNYVEFIRNSRQLFRPDRKLNTIITGRLEKYRGVTEEWLKKHNIQYDRLIMLNVKNVNERNRMDVGKYKAEQYKKSGCTLFVESSVKQATTIKNVANKPVFCTFICDLV